MVPSRDSTGDEAVPVRLVIWCSSGTEGDVEHDAKRQTGKIPTHHRMMFYRTVAHGALEQQIGREAYFAGAIESTLIVMVLASRAPVTLTFLPANFSGVVWSLSM